VNSIRYTDGYGPSFNRPACNLRLHSDTAELSDFPIQVNAIYRFLLGLSEFGCEALANCYDKSIDSLDCVFVARNEKALTQRWLFANRRTDLIHKLDKFFPDGVKHFGAALKLDPEDFDETALIHTTQVFAILIVLQELKHVEGFSERLHKPNDTLRTDIDETLGFKCQDRAALCATNIPTKCG
jgi:hypothetical protein